MKKILLVLGIMIVLAGIAGVGYWYWQSNQTTQQEPLRTIALDSPDIKSFDDVCATGTDGQLNCTGNIEQFDCESYDEIDLDLTYLQPHYPMLMCQNIKTISSKDAGETVEGVYAIPGSGLLAGRVTIVDYVIINDDAFQLVESEDQFRQFFQPINSREKATVYFQLLHKAMLVLDESSLNKLKSSPYGQYLVSPETFALSSVTEVDDEFIVTAYSESVISCIADLYGYTFLVKRDGSVVEQDRTLIWHSDLECTS